MVSAKGLATMPGTSRAKRCQLLFEFLGVEGRPVVEVVEVDGVLDRAIVGAAGRSEDRGAGFIAVDVAGDGGIQLGNGVGIERSAILGEDPAFAFDVAGFLGGDERLEGGLVDAQSIENHLVISGTDGGVVWMEFAGGTERGFEPQAWQVKDAERAGEAGTDEWDDLAHVMYGGDVLDSGR